MKYMYKCRVCNHRQQSDKDYSTVHVCEQCGAVDICLEEVNLYECPLEEIKKVVYEEQERRKNNEDVNIKYMMKTADGSRMALYMYSDDALNKILEVVEERMQHQQNAPKKEHNGFKITFGKYQGSYISDLPDSYVAWLLKNGIKDPLKSKLEEMIWNNNKDKWLSSWVEDNFGKKVACQQN